jgi:hypothetical protein
VCWLKKNHTKLSHCFEPPPREEGSYTSKFKKESDFKKRYGDVVSGKGLIDMRKMLRCIRRNYKYVDAAMIRENSLLETLLNALGLEIKQRKDGKWMKEVFQLGMTRLALTPGVTKMLHLAMIDERSVILKSMKRQLRSA